jgi:hypothetical protein
MLNLFGAPTLDDTEHRILRQKFANTTQSAGQGGKISTTQSARPTTKSTGRSSKLGKII